MRLSPESNCFQHHDNVRPEFPDHCRKNKHGADLRNQGRHGCAGRPVGGDKQQIQQYVGDRRAYVQILKVTLFILADDPRVARYPKIGKRGIPGNDP